MGRGRSKRKKSPFCRAPVQWPSALTGVFRDGAGKTCRPSAGSRRSAHFPRPRPACSARQSSGQSAHCLCSSSRFCSMVPRRKACGSVCAAICGSAASRMRRAPLRVKEKWTVSPTSPGRRVPQGPGVSVPDSRTGHPAFLRRRQEVRTRADRPAVTFFSFPPCTAHFLFDVSKRKWGGALGQAVNAAEFPAQWGRPSGRISPPKTGGMDKPPLPLRRRRGNGPAATAGPSTARCWRSLAAMARMAASSPTAISSSRARVRAGVEHAPHHQGLGRRHGRQDHAPVLAALGLVDGLGIGQVDLPQHSPGCRRPSGRRSSPSSAPRRDRSPRSFPHRR